MTLADDIGTYLAGKGRGTLPDPAHGVVGTIFSREAPAIPDAVIVVTSYAGQPPDWTTTSKTEKPSFQVRVRGIQDDPTIGEALIKTIYKDLDGLTAVTINGTRYIQIWTEQSDPNFMGRDENGRPEWVWNFYTLRKASR